MHEMSLAEGVLRILEEAARREGFRRVRVVWVEIGQLSSVEPEAMRFCFEVAARQGIADGARLEIVETPGRARCIPCAAPMAYTAYGDACPRCGGHQLELTQGTEMRVKDVEVE